MKDRTVMKALRLLPAILLASAVAAALSPRAQAASILVNGDFEQGGYSVTLGGYTDAGVPAGWTPNASFVRYYANNRIIDAPVESGVSALAMGNYDDEPLATLSQSYGDVAGDIYDVTFYATVGSSNGDPNAYLHVSVGSDGLTLHDDVPAAYQKYSFSFVGSGSDTLAISAQTIPSYWYVDNISIADASTASAVPETGTWAMMLLGFAGLGLASYRRKASDSGIRKLKSR